MRTRGYTEVLVEPHTHVNDLIHAGAIIGAGLAFLAFLLLCSSFLLRLVDCYLHLDLESLEGFVHI